SPLADPCSEFNSAKKASAAKSQICSTSPRHPPRPLPASGAPRTSYSASTARSLTHPLFQERNHLVRIHACRFSRPVHQVHCEDAVRWLPPIRIRDTIGQHHRLKPAPQRLLERLKAFRLA